MTGCKTNQPTNQPTNHTNLFNLKTLSLICHRYSYGSSVAKNICLPQLKEVGSIALNCLVIRGCNPWCIVWSRQQEALVSTWTLIKEFICFKWNGAISTLNGVVNWTPSLWFPHSVPILKLIFSKMKKSLKK